MIALSVFRRTGVSGLALACLMLWTGLSGSLPLLAQNRMGGRFNDPTRVNPIQQWQFRASEAELLGLIALEGAIDAEAYIVGPGDIFSITTGGEFPIVVAVAVSADGHLVLPEAGRIPAGGRSLAEVQTEAFAALQQRYRNVQVEVSLTMPRQFYVHITGAVPEPGRFLTQPMARVDDAIQQAFAAELRVRTDPSGETSPRLVGSATGQRPGINIDFRPALRNVVVTHRDGSRQTIDLLRYYTTGDTKDNPYLLDGDVVMVPSYHVRRDAVRVSGEVAYAGVFDVRPDDTVLDLLTLAAGPSGLAALGEVRLSRTLDDGATEIQTLDAQAIITGRAESLPIQAGDHLNVLPQEIALAAIQGRVQYPGTYTIENGKTTLRELVDLAGGLRPDANLRAAFLERRKSLDFRESGRASDLDFFSRVYASSFINKVAQRVIVDIEAALQPGGEDIVLYDEDRVVFPRDEGTVFVMGNVPRPGYVEYLMGQTARYYVDKAGGKGPEAKSVYIFEDGTGQLRVGEGLVVRSGDTVYVDREDIAESPEIAQLLLNDRNLRRQTRISTTQVIISGLTALTSVITAFVAVRSID